MASVAEVKLRPSDISARVLQTDPQDTTPEQAARSIERFLRRRHSALAEALEISAGAGEVIIRASGEVPHEMLHEVRELLQPDWERAPAREVEVDAEQFAIEVLEVPEEPLAEREILRSRARYLPYPVCEGFEISTGDLVLTDGRITYEPEWSMMQESEDAEGSGGHLIGLRQIKSCWRSEWLAIPCLMVETPNQVYRYGWPAERRELEKIFDVDEWLVQLRSMLAERQ